MLFWIIAALIALAVAAVLFRPAFRGSEAALPDGEAETGTDIAFYKAQLDGVERDLARGVIEPPEAARLRTEISRRILSADRNRPTRIGHAPRAAGLVMAALGALLLVGGALGGYYWLGQPGYPDLPLAGRIAGAAERLNDLPAQADAEAGVADEIAARIITPPENIAAIVADLHASLAENPDQPGELALLREFEASTRNFPEAARVSAQMNALAGDAVTVDDLLIEADLMLYATGGTVSREAAAIINRAADMDETAPGVRFLRGYLLSQVGRPDLAFGLWRPLAEGGEAFEPWRSRARLTVESAARAAGVDYALPDAPAAQGVTDADIRTMVEGLAARLADEGGPPEDWAQLVRALGVLGQTDRARAIWTEARDVFANDPGLALIDEAARGAGLAP
ncbi:MAG: c-type cytochrome biogenesis protein CcmI [Rubellimicrobium sp.]|nr:c-type cytochrome biogenesis protein CcmI [Rubellimicrobium sp.]